MNDNEIILKLILILASAFLIFGIVFGIQSQAHTPGGFFSFLTSTGFTMIAGVIIWLTIDTD